jgi:isopenicillin N synthase-like dioxygenase|tara:strand:- start:969 stop:1940 length:972 start_codon:yes stop_codon:yes gene_type:complete
MTKNLIPTINISSILKENFGSTESIKTINKIRKACVNIGFFQVTGHGISKKQIQRVCNVGIKFFKSTEQNKRKLAPKKWNKLNSNVYRGYFPSDVNGKEGLDIGDPMISSMFVKKNKRKKIERLNLSKSLNKNSISIIKKYYSGIFKLSELLFKIIISISKKDHELSKTAFQRVRTLSTLRFNYYPKQEKPVEISKEDGVALGCETHVDSGIFTVLYQDRKGGLQVQNRRTKKWYDVPFNRNALVVNTGLALEYLTNGIYKATNHRVLWNKSKRLSIPFFFEPSFDFKMNKTFFATKKYNKSLGVNYDNFLKNSLKKFIEYNR